MFDHDDIQLLRHNPQLRQLLTHYAELGNGDRKSWHDRLMEMAGLAPVQITRLHGEALAFEWLEQNTGAPRACYRITPSGMRVLKQVLDGAAGDVPDVTEAA